MNDPRPRPVRHGSGFRLEGPDFYVWDHDEALVRQAVADLGRGDPPQAPTEGTRPG